MECFRISSDAISAGLMPSIFAAFFVRASLLSSMSCNDSLSVVLASLRLLFKLSLSWILSELIITIFLILPFTPALLLFLQYARSPTPIAG